MPIIADWFVEHKVILVRAIGNMMGEDVASVIKQNLQLANESKNETIYVIYDLSQVTAIPPIPEVLQQLSNMPHSTKFKMMLIVGIQNMAMYRIVSVAARFANGFYRNFKTMDKAVAFLYHYAPELRQDEETA